MYAMILLCPMSLLSVPICILCKAATIQNCVNKLEYSSIVYLLHMGSWLINHTCILGCDSKNVENTSHAILYYTN